MSDYELEGLIKLRDETGEATHSASQGMKRLDDQSKKTGSGLQNFEGVLQTVQTALVTLGVVKAAKAVAGLALLGTQVERTEKAFRAISGGIAEADANLEAMRAGTRGAINDTEAMRAANKLLQMGLADGAEELQEMSMMATRLGNAMGMEAGPAIEWFTLLLANQSIQRLDEFGISSGRVRDRVEQLTKGMHGLSREQAFMQAVMEEGHKALDGLGDATDDNALSVEKATAAWENLKNEVGKAFASFSGIVKIATPILDFLTKQLNTINKLTEQYGYWEARIRSVVSLLSGGAYSPWGADVLAQHAAAPAPTGQSRPAGREPNWAQSTYREGAVMLSSPSSNITMYNPQFNEVSDAAELFEQLENLSP